MAISSIYYIDTAEFSTATAVWSNAALTTKAPDGYYSFGGNYRQQFSGGLLPSVVCDTCATHCGGAITGSGGQGIYLLNLDAGSTASDVGAIIVRFDPSSFPDGIRAVYNGNVYNKLSSPVDGFHSSSNPSGFTIVGNSGSTGTCSSSWYPSGGSILVDEFLYSGSSFSSTGNTQTISIASGDLSLNTVSPGDCIMVIPKVNASPSVINFEMLGPCEGTYFSVSTDCPTLLTGFSSSVVASTSLGACALSETVTYYNASLANTPGTIGLYDFVYSDAYGASPLSAGFYHATGSITGGSDWFQVDTNGVVVDTGVCSPEPPVESYNCVSGNCVDPGDGTGTYSTLLDCQNNCSAPTTYTFNWPTGGYIASIDSCSSTGTSTFPVYSSSPTLSIGNVLYTSSNLTSPLIGGNSFWKYNGNAYQINNSGQIINIVTCTTAFSATMTVGGTNQYGYRQGIYGSMSNTDISNPAGSSAVLTDLFSAGGTLAFHIINGSTTVPPNGWTALGINGTTYNRSSFTYSYNNPTNRWVYTLSLGTNPFGTTVGATRTITLI